MRQTRKTISIISLVTILAVALTIGLTMAFLQDTTPTDTNTFTVGKVDISLAEPGWSDQSQSTKILVPGRTITKDPTVTVAANSEDCYVRVAVTIPTALSGIITTPLTLNAGWTLGGDGYYYYNSIVTKSATDTVLPAVFSSIKVRSDATNETLAALSSTDLQIPVTAYAIQAEGFANAAAAWASFA